jgi:SAM-dependent methyltransferase
MSDSLTQLTEHIGIFQCPLCGGSFEVNAQSIHCLKCGQVYRIEDGIPMLFAPNDWTGRDDVTDKIKEFYERTPFPNYDEFDDASALIAKAERSVFGRILNDQIPFNTKVLEVGCGTGQLTNYLGIAHRNLFGTDMCFNSLRLAETFRARNDLRRVGFYQMNLFRPVFREASFDVVICNGVLHHTSDPNGGFRSIARLVKPGGYILIGLYNTYGRLATDVRRSLFRIFGQRLTFLDTHLRERISKGKWLAWFKDQYQNPHESKHTIDEALRWLDEAQFDFMSGIPSPVFSESFGAREVLFKPHARGTTLDHFLVQLSLIFKGSREGGFFVIIGRRRL